MVFGRLWEKQGLPEFLETLSRERKFEFSVERTAFAMALQRLCAPGSDLASSAWVKTVEAPGFEDLALQHFYRTSTFLAEVAQTYKSLWRVERTFREQKSTLEIRPIYHLHFG